ncbi:MAG: hypothetical protein HY654_04515 [Acidobacteria bacterium]|nr:hypothetical protein [Acidobacteriota bacterium]
MPKVHGKKRRPRKLSRRSYYVDVTTLSKARRLLGVASDAEALRIAVDRVVEMEEFWKFMKKSHGTLKPGSFELP